MFSGRLSLRGQTHLLEATRTLLMDIDLDWEAMTLRTSLDGRAHRAGLLGPPADIPFGAHASLQPGGGAEADKMLADMRDGLRHLYLFTWLERDVEPPPEVRIADIWLE